MARREDSSRIAVASPNGGMRGGLLSAGHYGKQAFGVVMVILGILIATGLDKSLEGWILDRSPDWLTHLTTRF